MQPPSRFTLARPLPGRLRERLGAARRRHLLPRLLEMATASALTGAFHAACFLYFLTHIPVTMIVDSQIGRFPHVSFAPAARLAGYISAVTASAGSTPLPFLRGRRPASLWTSEDTPLPSLPNPAAVLPRAWYPAWATQLMDGFLADYGDPLVSALPAPHIMQPNGQR